MIQQIRHIFRRLFNKTGGIRYKIGGVVYIQRPLVLLQIEQLVEVINPAMFEGVQGSGVAGLVRALGDKLAGILAIILTPEGTAVDEKDLLHIAFYLRNHVDIETAIKVGEDFLSCNPVRLVFDKLTGALEMAGPLATAMTGPRAESRGTGSPSSSASSQAET